MGKVDEMHARVFRAIHVEKVNLAKEEAILEWMGKQPGIDMAKFKEMYSSFNVASQVRRASQLQRRPMVSKACPPWAWPGGTTPMAPWLVACRACCRWSSIWQEWCKGRRLQRLKLLRLRLSQVRLPTKPALAGFLWPEWCAAVSGIQCLQDSCPAHFACPGGHAFLENRMDIHSPIPPEARDSGMGVRHVPGRRLLRRWAPALVSLALLAGVGFVRAEKADRNKPMKHRGRCAAP